VENHGNGQGKKTVSSGGRPGRLSARKMVKQTTAEGGGLLPKGKKLNDVQGRGGVQRNGGFLRGNRGIGNDEEV